MLVKLTYVGIAIIVLNSICVVLSIEKGYYTIVAPGSIRPESVFHVSFTLNYFHTSCWFNISFTSFFNNNKLYEFETIEVQPRTTKLVEYLAPPSNSILANLEVLGHCGGIQSKDTSVIHFEPEHYWTFIQTNKAKYKPGELVKFRVICIDQLKRPAGMNQNISIQIYDNQYNLVKKFFDVKLLQGVFRSELQLSNYPVLGLWKIKVLSNGIYADKMFEVDRYVLPKFDVKINTKKVFAINDGQIPLEIIASNFFGEPVKGNLLISISSTDLPWNAWVPTPPPLLRESKINGETTIFIDLKNDLQLEEEIQDQRPLPPFSAPITPYIFHIEAIVFDDSNGERSWTTTEIQVHSQRYKIELQAPNEFDSDEILNIKVKVRITDFQDNPIILETKTSIEIVVGCYEKIGRYIHSYADFDEVRIEYDENQIGKNFSIINVINNNYTECYLYAEYQRVKSSTERMYKKVKEFAMDVLTEIPEEGKELEIKITNPEPFEEFSYEILSRKDIIQSGRVFVPGNQTTYILRLNVTFLMVPKITIYAHHIQNINFGGQLKDVIIKRALQNSIEITTVNVTSPDTSVNINVTTNEGSYVGLMALDLSALQNIDKMNILTEDYVNEKLRSVNSLMSYAIPFYGRTADIITFSNAFPPGRENGPSGGDLPNGLSPKRIKNHFPESWLFKDFHSTPAGSLNLMEVAPDPSVSSWAITGFSLHPDTGLTFTKNTTNLKVYQEFFVSMDLPSSVKEGEIIEVPIYIANYMNQDTLVNVTFETDSGNLDILEHPEDISKTKQNISKLISGKKREKILIYIKPLKPGRFNVTVRAFSSVAIDALQKTLNVQPQGIPYASSKNYLVHLTEESVQEDEITIDIPENATEGSQEVEVSVVGDIFQPLIRDLQELAEYPFGNGEDNVKLIVYNSIVLKYLKALNYSNPSLECQMKLNLALSYQNQLSFKYLDGSFGLFERKSEKTGDIWQTIFALWGLKQADYFISVDSKVINKGLGYLKSKQQENGCYKSGSGIEEDVKLTAFGLMVFLMDEDSRTTCNPVITKGLAYLYDTLADLDNTPLAAYVLRLGKHYKAGDFLRKSNTRLTRTKQVVWKKSDELRSHLELIADSLMNLFEFQKIPEPSLLEIVRGLIASKKEEPYVTHMIALQAMLPFVEKLFMYRTNLKLRFKDDQNKSGDFRINDENFQLFQTIELSPNSRKIKLQSRGHGFAMVDVKYKYNLLPLNQSSSFYSPKITIEKYSKFLTYLLICPRELTNNSTQSELIIMEIHLQSGCIFSERDFNDIENQSEDIKSVQFNEGRNKAVVYIEDKSRNETCVELEVRKTYKVFNSKPGWVIVYGTNNKDQKATRSFQISES